MTGNHYAITTEHARLLSTLAETKDFKNAAWGFCWNEIARQAEREGKLWKSAWYSIKAAFHDRSRRQAAMKSSKTALYSLTPSPLRALWRGLKGTPKASA